MEEVVTKQKERKALDSVDQVDPSLLEY